MFKILIIGFSIIAINVVLQAWASTYWTSSVANKMSKRKGYPRKSRIFRFLILLFLFLTLLHIVHSLIWAGAFYFIPKVQADFTNFMEIVYFSIVTFTTLGYGDITINSEWKLLSGIEAINGIMLIGWSTALMFSMIQNTYTYIKNYDDRKGS